jgi:hypothetical protein
MGIYENYFKKIENPEIEDRRKVLFIESLASTGKELQPFNRRLAEEFAPRFEQLLRIESPKVRAAIVKALGSFGIKYYATLIIPLLDDSDAEVCGAVIIALDKMDARIYHSRIKRLEHDRRRCSIKNN